MVRWWFYFEEEELMHLKIFLKFYVYQEYSHFEISGKFFKLPVTWKDLCVTDVTMLQISGVKALSDIPVYYIIYIAKNVRLVITENNFLSHVIFFNKTWLGPLNKNVPGVIWSYFILQLFKTSNFSVNIASNHGTGQSTVFSLMSASTISSAYIPRRFKYTWCVRRAGTDYISDS